jgi:hypothetical protein
MPLARSDHPADDPANHPELIEDPRVLAQFLSILVEQHHPVGDEVRSMCSCGEPYFGCPVAAQIRPLLAAAPPREPAGPSHWFG